MALAAQSGLESVLNRFDSRESRFQERFDELESHRRTQRTLLWLTIGCVLLSITATLISAVYRYSD